MKYIYRLSVLVISTLIIVICFSFNTESILSKLKSLSYLIRLIDNYYVEDVDLNKIARLLPYFLLTIYFFHPIMIC